MGKIAVLADKDTAMYFKLAGLQDAYFVKDAKEAENRLRELLERPDFTIILVTERIVNQIHPTIEKITEKRRYPLVITIPDIRGPVAKKVDLIVELIKRKMGIEIKLE